MCVTSKPSILVTKAMISPSSIAAVFIGGASFYGGSGKILGTLVGALVIAVIQFGLVFVDMDPFWQYLAVGMVIIIAVLIDQSKSHLSSRAS